MPQECLGDFAFIGVLTRGETKALLLSVVLICLMSALIRQLLGSYGAAQQYLHFSAFTPFSLP